MVLTLDIGNTNINLGLFDGDTICMRARFATQRDNTDDQFAVLLHTLVTMHGIDPASIQGGIISSVVPELTAELENAVYILTGKKPLCLVPGVKTGLNILIDNPAQLGADLAAGRGRCSHALSPARVCDRPRHGDQNLCHRRKQRLSRLYDRTGGARIAESAHQGQLAAACYSLRTAEKDVRYQFRGEHAKRRHPRNCRDDRRAFGSFYGRARHAEKRDRHRRPCSKHFSGLPPCHAVRRRSDFIWLKSDL